MLRARVCFQVALLVSIVLTTGILAQTHSLTPIGNNTLVFEETGNGLGSGDAAFKSRVSGLSFQFYQSRGSIDIATAGTSGDKPVRLTLSGANQTPSLTPEGKLPGIVNYLPSSDVSTWRTNLRTWSSLHYRDIYPGIDLVYYGNYGQMEYDFVVAPHRDPRQIAIEIGSAHRISISPDGALNISGGASLRFSKPVIYQLAEDGSRVLIAGNYVMKSAGRIGFEISRWDHSRPLIIDPVLVWSSFVGSSGDTFNAAAIDSSSNVYLTGRNGGELLVEKVSSNGTTVVYRTVITATPSYSATAEDIRVDSSGNAYIVGYAGVGFPTTSNAFMQSVTSGSQHAFVAVLNSAGSALTYATYLTGTTSAQDQANGVALDSTNKIYVTGFTYSATFPTTTGVIQTKNINGSSTTFVAKFDPTQSGAASLIYSTLLSGPTTASQGNAIAVDSSDNAYVTGNAGYDFPTTKGAFSYDGEGLGQGGVYVSKINSTATALDYSAYLGPGTANGIAVDGAGDAYLAGNLSVEDFPTTTGAYQVIYPAGFATELNATGSALVYSTFLSGPSENINVTDVTIEPGCASACAAFVTGYTAGDDLPLTNPIQNFNASFVNGSSGNDVFVTELNGTGTAAVYSTYIGGSSDDSTEGTAHSPAIAANATGDAFVVGATYSPDFPVTLTTTPQRYNFALRIGAAAGTQPVTYPTTLAFSTSQPVGVASSPLAVTLRNMGSSALTISSITPSPSVYSESNTCGSSLAGGSECTISVTFKPTSAGSTPGTLTINGTTVVNLTGTGAAQPFLTLSPTSLTFADQLVGTASPSQAVTVGNIATTSLVFSNPPFTMGNSNFAQTNNCPTSLAQNATCTVNVAFLPTQNGAISSYMVVSSNTSGSVPTTTVNLSGNGLAGTPTLTLGSAGLTFNPQVVGLASPQQSLIVTNTGNVPVTIYGVSSSIADYTVSGCVQTLSPGTTCSVRVVFTPAATGTRSATVTLADSTQVGTHTFTATGTGIAATETLVLNPPGLQFADLAVGATSGQLLIQVTNTGDAPVLVDRVFTTGDFRLNSTGCVTTLRVAQICSAYVEFTPTATGARTGTLVFEDSASGSPQSATLSGNGLTAAPIAIVSPDNLNFGTQAQGTVSPNPLTVTLTNSGNLPFDASNVTFGGTNASDFQFSGGNNGCQEIVTPGRTCQVQITFTPTGTGSRSGTLIFTNAAGSQDVDLSGNGVTATSALGLTPASMTFQAQQKGVASPSQVGYVRNTGTAAVTISSIASGSSDYSVSNGCSTLQPNTSCQFYITFTPTVSSGADDSTLTFTTSPSVTLPAFSLTGAGATALPAMQLSPAGLAFTNQVVSTASSAQSVTVVNNSGSTVTSIAFALSGTNKSDYNIASNGCTSTLSNSSECSFQVTFTPGAAGVSTAAVTITDSAGTQTVSLAGYGVAATTGALLVDNVLTFPSETVGITSPQQSITVQNTGNTAISVQSVTVETTGDPKDFTISGTSCSTTLNAYASCSAYVTFTPTAAGTRTATVAITYTLSGGSPTTVTITLSGTGIAATTALEAGPKSITFPPQVLATTSQTSPTVVLTNTGTSPVTLTVPSTLGGTDPTDFAISNGCSSPLPQGPISNTCQISVSFKPTATGSRTATIPITYGPSNTPLTINLSGTGLAQTQSLVVTPTTLAFDPQTTGTTSSSQTITVTNTGNYGVAFSNVTITTGFAFAPNGQGCVGTLSPGSSCTISVTYTASSTTGKATGTVSITSSASTTAKTVSLSGTSIATSSDVLLSQTAVVFDAQTVASTSGPQYVYYYNQGATTVTINTVTQTDTEFSLSGSSCAAGSQVTSQSSCRFQITFTPSAAGTRSSSITIADTLTSSRTITLSGIGISSAVPEVNLTPASLTFATIAEGTTSAPLNINLTNNGTGVLSITSIALTGTNPTDFAQTNNCPSSLAAGFSCNIAVTFTPVGVATYTAKVTVTDNATGNPQSVTLTGTGKTGPLPIVTLTPTSLAFPNIPINTASKAQVVTVKNTGAAALNITNISITGTVPTDFSETNTCTSSIAVGSTCTISVTFTPSTIENQTGSVSITDNAANSPQTVPITGNGAEPAVDLSPSALAFASQKVGTTSAPLTVTVENYGDATLTFSSINVTGPFLISANTCGSSLAPGLTCTISVEFKPTQTGAAAGDLVLTDNAGDSPQMIALSGTGS